MNSYAISYLTSIANEHNYTPATPLAQFDEAEGYQMIRDIYAPSITTTAGEYTTDNIRHAMAAAIAEHDLRKDMYRAEAEYARRLDDTDMWEISTRLVGKETTAIDAIRRVARMAGLRDYPIFNIQAAMISARRAGESNWAYVGMVNWEAEQADTSNLPD